MESEPTLKSMIGFAWKTSKEMLFPFQFKRWFKILIIVWLAGAGVQGCGVSSFKPPVRTPKATSQMIQKTSVEAPFASSGTQEGSGREVSVEGVTPAAQQPETPAGIPATKKTTGPVALRAIIFGGLLLFAISFVFFFMWVACRFNFVMLDVLAKRNVSIMEPFRQNKETGDSYFKWSLAFLGVGIAGIATAVLLAWFLGVLLKGQTVLSSLAVVAGSVLVLLSIAAILVIGIVVRDFVTPIMYREKIRIKDAWGRFLQAGSRNFRAVAKYVLVLMGLGLVAMVLQAVVGIVIFLVGLLGGGLLMLPGIVLIKVIPLLKVPLLILGVSLGAAFVLAAIAAIQMVMLPVAVFFRMFALTYLTRLYPDCDLLNFKTQV